MCDCRLKDSFTNGYVAKGTNIMLTSIPIWACLQQDRRAVTAVEYAMIVGIVVAIIMVGFGDLATDISNKFHSIGNNL